jgi:oxygen-dependent protoporphyrinogen oxidase
MKVGIIGGGISGLTVAYYLQKKGISYDLFEQADQPGGNIKTIRAKNYLLEMGPNSLQLTPELELLLKELKLENEVIETAPAGRNRYIFRNGAYRILPASLANLLTNTYFSWKTRYRILQERFLKPGPFDPHETVSHFFARRFNQEVVDYAVAPFFMGIYAGNPDELLIHKTFPDLPRYEAEYGSVTGGILKNPLQRRKVFSFRQGLQTLPDAIASKLIDVHTGYPVEMVTKTHGKYIVSTSSPDYVNCEYDALVLALPAPKAASVLEFTFPGVAAALQNVDYPPVAVVHTIYRRAEVGFPLEGFGALHPKSENQFTAGVVWSSSLFPGRCSDDEVLFTTLIGGATAPENARKPRTEILTEVHQELKRNYQITAERPVYQHFYLWHHALPQYTIFIEDAHEMTQKLETERVFTAANWFSGVSVPDCIKRAGEVVQKIQDLAASQTIL